MTHVEVRKTKHNTTYWLDGRQLHSGDEVLLRLRGNRGWEPVRIKIDGDILRVLAEAEDGHRLVTSLPPQSELRWD